jgi:two-component system alkaline phosphatase synthesis response regulator PhoP/two-component system response regulator VicR
MATTKAAMDGPRAQRVLVCDDERHIVRLLQANLERHGHTVVCAFDGDEAIRILESTGPLDLSLFDKVVLDAMMPKVDGYEVLRWIRTHERTRDVWVAMMIPRAQDRELWERQPYRADVYVTKPFNPGDLFR